MTKDNTMKRYGYLLTVALIGISVAGCMTPQGKPDATATGVLGGAAVGAIIGSTARNPGAGAAVGAAVGALAGGAVGHGIDQAQETQEAQLRAQSQQQQVQDTQPLTIDDIISMTRARISDDLIISQIRNSRTIYHLRTADIVALKRTGVSERVIDFMINSPAEIRSAETATIARAPMPPPMVEPVIVAPGPGYFWMGGSWIWFNGGWSWRHGYWRGPYRSGFGHHGYGRHW
jgi:uncharacterized protein YcfJ